MSNHAANSRRRIVRLVLVGLAATPLAGALVSQTARGAAARVRESDPKATALGYKADATKATARKDPAQTCASCNLYSGKDGAAEGPCALFEGNLVTAKGWCTAWAGM
jgi:hypothetical protein